MLRQNGGLPWPLDELQDACGMVEAALEEDW
jgi:hypothetical protein